METEIRLQKILADRGVASRRASAEIIAAGRVTVNGETVDQPGFRVDPTTDRIVVDGSPLQAEQETRRTILLYKPRGYICSRSDKQGKTVYELLKGIPERIVPAGRLDKDSEGLLLLSNDGDLIERLTHPRFRQEKVYRVTVSGSLAPEVIDQLRQPMEIEGAMTTPARVKMIKERGSRAKTPRRQERTSELRAVLEFILNEGRNRQVRRLCERSSLRVHRLVRTRVGELTLKGLKPGQWREVSARSLVAPCDSRP